VHARRSEGGASDRREKRSGCRSRRGPREGARRRGKQSGVGPHVKKALACASRHSSMRMRGHSASVYPDIWVPVNRLVIVDGSRSPCPTLPLGSPHKLSIFKTRMAAAIQRKSIKLNNASRSVSHIYACAQVGFRSNVYSTCSPLDPCQLPYLDPLAPWLAGRETCDHFARYS
jgi:hypothetical protein